MAASSRGNLSFVSSIPINGSLSEATFTLVLGNSPFFIISNKGASR